MTLLRALLVIDPAKRFGAVAGEPPAGRWAGEAERIRDKWRRFAWWTDVDWARLLARQAIPTCWE